MRPRETPSAGGHEARRCRSRSRAVGRGAGRPRGAVPDAGGPGLGRARSGPRTRRRVGCAPSPSASSDPARAARRLPGARAPGPSGSIRRRRSAAPGGRHRRGSPQTDACPGGGGDRTGARGPDARLRALRRPPSARAARRPNPCPAMLDLALARHRVVRRGIDPPGPSLGRLAPVPATDLRLEPRRARDRPGSRGSAPRRTATWAPSVPSRSEGRNHPLRSPIRVTGTVGASETGGPGRPWPNSASGRGDAGLEGRLDPRRPRRPGAGNGGHEPSTGPRPAAHLRTAPDPCTSDAQMREAADGTASAWGPTRRQPGDPNGLRPEEDPGAIR